MGDDKVMIVGCGIGGLSLAVGLQRNGVPISVHEIQPEVKELGTGVGIQRVAQQGLVMLGLSEAVERIGGTPFEEQLIRSSRTGRILARIPRRGEAFIVNRGELLAALLEQLPDPSVITCSSEFVGYEQDERGTIARFADGREERAAALVGADGARSVTRRQVVGDGQPQYSGQTAWRGMPKWTHPTLPLNVSEQVWGPGTVFGLFPCNERMFWYASDVRPEGSFTAPSARKADLLRTFGDFPEAVPELLEATPEDGIFQGDLYIRPLVDSWTKGSVTLLGDAAHPTMPAFGQGGCMAIEDAAVLARELGSVGDLKDRGAITAALGRYEEKRVPRTKGMVQKAGIFARMNSWKNTPGVVARDAVISAIPKSIWLRTYEHEHTYQL